MEEEEEKGALVEVSAEEGAGEKTLSSGSERALLKPEGDGRHRVAHHWDCILQMETAKFNCALKCIFLSLLLWECTCVLASYSALFPAVVLGTVLFALCVDVKRPGWNVRLAEWTYYSLKEVYHNGRAHGALREILTV